MRPATPLSILFFAAFALLLLSSLSTPVIKGIPLATYNGINFGVWGACEGDQCTSVNIGYSDNALAQISNSAFSLPASTRKSLSSLLIVHVVAAFLGLVCLGLALAAHFHSPSHSPRYLLGLFILTIPTILVALFAFLVDILLFVPHVRFGGWIVLAATVVLFIASVITCFMRRTLVSRKARRQRIAENAEMNGQNYFETRRDIDPLPRAESPPPLSGESMSPLKSEKLPGMAAFETLPSPEDRVPLHSNASNGSLRSPPGGRGMPPPRRDQYGNPLPQEFGQPLRQQQSNNSLQSTHSNRSGPSPVYGGRGGYPPGPGRGGYPPRGGMMRGGMPPQGMRGPPPPGFASRGRGGPGGMMGRGGAPPGAYGRQDQFYNGQQGRGSPFNGPPPRSNPPPMDVGIIGQALELDAEHGLPSPSHSRPGSAGTSPVQESMPAIANTLAPPRTGEYRNVSPTSDYSAQGLQASQDYVPPRAQWGHPNQRNFETPPLRDNRALSPIEGSPSSPTALGGYIEDVDPAFATAQPLPSSLMPGSAHSPTRAQFKSPSPLSGQRLHVPTNPTMTKFLNPTESSLGDPNRPSYSGIQHSTSTDSLPDGQRSPAASETSNFTSISQRGVNPNWRPPPPPGMPRQRQNDAVLTANPDFMLPGAGPRRGGYRGGPSPSMSPPRGAYPTGPSAGGRYPGAF